MQMTTAACDESEVAFHGGGGNCTRMPSDASCFPDIICENCTHGLSEGCRDSVALHELVAAWHGLTPKVRAAITELARGVSVSLSGPRLEESNPRRDRDERSGWP